MQGYLRGRDPGRGHEAELSEGGHVEVEAGLIRKPGHRLAEKGLGGKGDDRTGGLRLEGLPVLDAPPAKRILINDIEWRREILRQLDGIAAAYLEMPPLVDGLCSI